MIYILFMFAQDAHTPYSNYKSNNKNGTYNARQYDC